MLVIKKKKTKKVSVQKIVGGGVLAGCAVLAVLLFYVLGTQNTVDQTGWNPGSNTTAQTDASSDDIVFRMAGE